MTSKRVDIRRVAGAALASIDTLLPEWLPGGRRDGHEFKALNPTRADDKIGSFSVNLNSGAWGDFATDDKGGDLVSLYAYIKGLTQLQAAKSLAQQLGVIGEAAAAPLPEKSQRRRTEWEPVLPVPEAAGDPPKAHIKRGRPEASWRYHNAAGELLGVIYRFKTSDGGKEVLPCVWARHAVTGAAEWRWMAFPVPRPLYGLRELADDPRRPVLIVEGEKCADAGRGALRNDDAASPLAVVSWPGGSKAVDKADWGALAGRPVIIWPDCDAQADKAGAVLPEALQPGVKAAERIAELLAALSPPARVKIVAIPTPGEKPSGWDIADAIAEGWTREQLFAYLRDRQRAPSGSDEPGAEAADLDASPRPPEQSRDAVDSTADASHCGPRSRKPPGRSQATSDPADTHETMATEMGTVLAEQSGERPVFTEGDVWTAEGALWVRRHIRELRNIAAAMFAGRKLAQKQRDFSQIVERLQDRAHNIGFFSNAPLGVATPNGFWAVRDRELKRLPREAAQRQRFELEHDPEFDERGDPAEAPLFDGFLDETFEGDGKAEQILLLQEVFGAALLGLLARLQIAVLFWGKTRSGKGVIVRILERLFPRDVVTSVSPANWGHEYHRAALAGMRLNVVGEVDPKRPIPSGDFKSLIGWDLIGARNPTHAPFSFRNEAAHIFSGNFFPPATDRDPAFYIRWRILKFDNSAAGHEDDRLSDRIAQCEMPEVLAWALKGAERVAARGALATTRIHDELLDKWRVEHSSALSFLLDEERVILDSRHPTCDPSFLRRREAFEAYGAWCRAEGRHPMGSQGFYSELRAAAGKYGVIEEKRAVEGWGFSGLRVLP